MHVFCYLGMYFFGGRIDASQPHWATLPVPASLYYLLNFNTYREGMLTLFMLVRRVGKEGGKEGRKEGGEERGEKQHSHLHFIHLRSLSVFGADGRE